ncbi:HPr kinase/phosphatase C-terminal domain-containing protein [Qipengyuania sp. MTN3-11]
MTGLPPLANVTCVAVSGRGLLIEGPPGSGKSSLALALIDRGAVLVGDDGIVLEPRASRLWASPPPRIAGKLELRGIGLIEFPTTSAPVSLVLSLDPAAPRFPEIATRQLAGIAVPLLAFRTGDAIAPLRAEKALVEFGLA